MASTTPHDDGLPVLVIGAGLSGLCCALRLREAGRPVRVLEAQDRVGGRIVTDRQDGFLLDRGFQVLLTSYPEVQERLDGDALGLAAFRSGSAVRLQDRIATVADPYREPWTAVRSLFSVLSIRDALRANGMRRRLLGPGPHAGTAADVLQASGISPSLQQAFFTPFFQGVTLDPELSVPGDYFAFLFRMFAEGKATLPKDGMGAVPQQLADHLPEGTVQLGTRVRSVAHDHVVLDDGTRVDGSAVVVAAEGAGAAALTGVAAPTHHHGTTCLSFAIEGDAPFTPRLLLLNGTGAGPILHLSVPSVVQPSYAPAGFHLLSVTVLGDPDGDPLPAVRAQLQEWFGQQAAAWLHLQTCRVPRALPALSGPAQAMARPGFERLGSGVWVCGDHLATPSIQGAMAAGRAAAESVLALPQGPTGKLAVASAS